MSIYLQYSKDKYDVIRLKDAILRLFIVFVVAILVPGGFTMAFLQKSGLNAAIQVGIALGVSVAITFLFLLTAWKWKWWRFSLPKGKVLTSRGQQMINSMRRP